MALPTLAPLPVSISSDATRANGTTWGGTGARVFG
jgi:hypothetical protein